MVISHRSDAGDAAGIVEGHQIHRAFDYVKRFRLAQMLMRPDIGVLGMHDKHLVKTVIGAPMGAQSYALALVMFGVLLEEIDILPTNSDSRFKAVQNLFALFSDMAGVVHW